ncbi:hypothetical protein D9619_003651 [Psilocybe cf. subviscida]|uniref:BTB domain-containing protein n=1 Tax=Psilocybe cf. subviscida TaxID=2480587 RepID=A0A8H5EUK3_9AGAR|nr:hypothetical protein D9619_003651 [Psilocybe cf. subviscida]
MLPKMQAKDNTTDESLPVFENTIIDRIEAIPAEEVQFSSFWNLDTVIIKVESTLFNVPRQVLDVPGTTFADMFSIPLAGDKTLEGQSKTNPIILDSSFSAHDFDAFLRMLLSPIKNPVSGYDEFLGVLRLAHKWNYDEIREKAIQALTPLIKGSEHAATKVHLGKQFLVQEWLRQGLIDISVDLDLGLEDLANAPFRFDTDYISRIFFIQKEDLRESDYREKRICRFCHLRTVNNSGKCARTGCARLQPSMSTAERVEKVFGDELAAYAFHPSC